MTGVSLESVSVSGQRLALVGKAGELLLQLLRGPASVPLRSVV